MFLIYVDDIIVTGPNSPLIDRLITTLQDDFAIKNLGPIHFFLGVEAINADEGLYVSQWRYITDLLKKHNMHEAKPITSLWPPQLFYHKLLVLFFRIPEPI